MAEGEKRPLRTKKELVAALEQSRHTVSMGLPPLRHALNPIERVKQSFSRHPILWVAGSAAAGLAGTRILSSSRRQHPEPSAEPSAESKSFKLSLAPLLGFLVKSAITAARPAATAAVKKQVSKLME